MEKQYFLIGEVSKLTNTSVQTLRFYDKIDLFKPSFTDPDNQYRYYSNTQLFYLDIIKSLKHVGVPLSEIKSILQLSAREIAGLLDEQETKIEQQLRRLEDVKAILSYKKKQILDQPSPDQLEKVYIKRYEKQRILTYNQAPSSATIIPVKEYGHLMKVLEDHGTVFDSVYCATYPLKKYDSIHDWQYTSIFTPVLTDQEISVSNEFMEIDELPAGEYVCIAFHSAEDVYESCYETLYSYILNHKIPTEKIVYEWYMPFTDTAVNEDDFIVELKVQIKSS
jgi:MerR family transcriptional activator of bmr gene